MCQSITFDFRAFRPHPQFMLKRSALRRNFLMSPTVGPKGTYNATHKFFVTVANVPPRHFFTTRHVIRVVRVVRWVGRFRWLRTGQGRAGRFRWLLEFFVVENLN